MTEEIIIDSIDVSKCEAFFKANKTCYNCYACEGSNCYFKQLKRLEQENKELGRKAFLAEQNVRTTAATFCEKDNKINELEKENKELKEELKSYKHPDVVTLLTNWRTGELDRIHNKIANERDTYRSALEEIREIAMGIMDDDIDEGSAYYDANQIINKINEVLDEGVLL